MDSFPDFVELGFRDVIENLGEHCPVFVSRWSEYFINLGLVD